MRSSKCGASAGSIRRSSMAATPFAVLIEVTSLLERLGIPYLIGGSIASSVYGIPRTTADLDLVIELRADQLESLAEGLEPAFYVSRQAMHEAFRTKRSFNVIHLESVEKVDLFIVGDDPFDREEFGRRTARELPGIAGSFLFKTAEDTVLRKLLWFRSGGERSEVQWRDVVGVLKIQTGRLDDPYLRHWADRLGVSDLLERARNDALR